MSSKIVLDCDGVLLDWYLGFSKWMERHGFHEEEDGYYSISKRFGIEVAKGKQLVTQFNESAAIGFLSPYMDAVRGIHRLYTMGYKFEVVTSLSNYKYSQLLRESNLNNCFYPVTFDKVYCLDTGEDKLEILSSLYKNSNYFWIEDKLQNAIDGYEVGLRPILLRHSHHKTEIIPDYIPIFDTWNEVVEYITKNDL